MSIQDLRGTLMDLGSRRAPSSVNKVAIHYSGGKTGDAHSFQNWWKSGRGWSTGGYHEIILTDGTRQICYADNVITNGVFGHNTTTFHICYVGLGEPNAKQMPVLIQAIKEAVKRFGLKPNDVLGHREFTGQSTACPGADMSKLRRDIAGTTTTPAPAHIPNILGRDCSRFTCKGSLVKEYQEKLLKLGEKLPRFGTDGDFGQETEDATKAFQSRHKLTIDGIAGTQTLIKVEELIKAIPVPQPVKKEEVKFMLEKAIVINSFADYPAAERLANRLNVPIFTRVVAEKSQIAKEVIICGGYKGKLKANKFTDLSGKTLFETFDNINKFMK